MLHSQITTGINFGRFFRIMKECHVKLHDEVHFQMCCGVLGRQPGCLSSVAICPVLNPWTFVLHQRSPPSSGGHTRWHAFLVLTIEQDCVSYSWDLISTFILFSVFIYLDLLNFCTDNYSQFLFLKEAVYKLT